MSRVDKRNRRQAEHLAWLKLHGRVCVICGAEDREGMGNFVTGSLDDQPDVLLCEGDVGTDDEVVGERVGQLMADFPACVP